MSRLIQLERRAGPEQAGLRLDQAAAELFPDYSRARLQLWIRQGSLTVDGQAGRPAQRLAGGELLRLQAEPEPDQDVVAQALPLEVIHADAHLLVLNKAAGMVVHPAAGNPDGTLQNALLHHDPELAEVPRAGIVHRLDKDTSGVMVVARSLKAHASLVRQLQDRSMSRVYETVVHGLAARSGTVDAPIGRHPRDRQRMAVVERGKAAVSHYRTLRHFRHFSHLEVSLESGRTHQIRVHMQHIGLPVVGDPVYGRRLRKNAGLSEAVASAVEAFPRQALHARRLQVLHPVSGERCSFEAPLPADVAGLLDVLKRHDR
jgi:23S rRNA pseudouridine1911/1915/1917 synthase